MIASTSIQPIGPAEMMPFLVWAFAGAAVTVAALACALCVSRWRGLPDGVHLGGVALLVVVVALTNGVLAWLMSAQETPTTWWGPAQWVATVSAVIAVIATVMSGPRRNERVSVRGES